MALDLDAGAHQISFLAIRNTTPTTEDAEDTEKKTRESKLGLKARELFANLRHQFSLRWIISQ